MKPNSYSSVLCVNSSAVYYQEHWLHVIISLTILHPAMILAIHSSCNVNGMYHTQLLKEWGKNSPQGKMSNDKKANPHGHFLEHSLCLPTTVLRNKPNANWHIQFQFLIWINLMLKQGSLKWYIFIYFWCNYWLSVWWFTLSHPTPSCACRLNPDTQNFASYYILGVQICGTICWGSQELGTCYWSFLLQLIYREDHEHMDAKSSGFAPKSTLLISWLSHTVTCWSSHWRWHFICKRIIYLSASFDAERVINTDAQGGPLLTMTSGRTCSTRSL